MSRIVGAAKSVAVPAAAQGLAVVLQRCFPGGKRVVLAFPVFYCEGALPAIVGQLAMFWIRQF